VAARAAAAFAAAVGVAAALGGAATAAGGGGAEAEAVAAEVGAGGASPHRHLHQFSNGYEAWTILGGFADSFGEGGLGYEYNYSNENSFCAHPLTALFICPVILGGAGLTALAAELVAILGSAAWPTVQSLFS